MYNLRYHIASLVSVFLALSVGLLLGGITVQSGVLTKQRAALVQSLRTDYTKLSTANQTLEQELKLEKQLAASLVDDAVAGKLADKNVLVLTNAGQVAGLSATEQAIRSAGGNPVVVTLNDPRLGLDRSEVTTAMSAALGGTDGENSVDGVAQALETEWNGGAPGPVTAALVQAKVFEDPNIPTTGFEGVVDLASFEGKADEGALALAAHFMGDGVTAIGGQATGSETNVAIEANGAGLSALDTLGTDTGRYTLVMLLAGAKSGYYGTGQPAVAPFPAAVSTD